MPQFLVSCAKGLEEVLRDELQAVLLGVNFRVVRAGLRFEGKLEDAYSICLNSRIASRVLMPIAEFDAPDPKKLYAGIKRIKWSDHFTPEETIAIEFHSKESEIYHTQFGAQKTKDAIVDQFMSNVGARPNVDVMGADIRIHVYLDKNHATVSLDLSGGSLHRRGYRIDAGEAPLKESLASGLLRMANWEPWTGSWALLDPMCGSGTLVIEGALKALQVAPGLLKPKFGFTKWKQFQVPVFDRLVDGAKKRMNERITELRTRADSGTRVKLTGSDMDERVLRVAKQNWDRVLDMVPELRAAGQEKKPAPAPSARGSVIRRKVADQDWIEWKMGRFQDLGAYFQKTIPAAAYDHRLLISNPPYGERMGDFGDLMQEYSEMGDILKKSFTGWRACILTENSSLISAIGLKPSRRFEVLNGKLDCRFLTFDLYEGSRP